MIYQNYVLQLNEKYFRDTNKYGYGQDVVKIACDAVDSVQSLVDQVTS